MGVKSPSKGLKELPGEDHRSPRPGNPHVLGLFCLQERPGAAMDRGLASSYVAQGGILGVLSSSLSVRRFKIPVSGPSMVI